MAISPAFVAVAAIQAPQFYPRPFSNRIARARSKAGRYWPGSNYDFSS
jgi:hypothetical protein